MSICKRGDALSRSGDLEIHVAEMIFVAENVGQNRKAAIFLDQAHGDTGDRGRHRNARIHQRQRRAADGRHRGRAVGFGDFRHHAHGVGEFVLGRQQRMHRAPGQLAMADFAASGAAHAAGFTDRVGREVVMQHEVFAVFARQRVDDLLILAGAERGDDQRLRFAAREQAPNHARAAKCRLRTRWGAPSWCRVRRCACRCPKSCRAHDRIAAVRCLRRHDRRRILPPESRPWPFSLAASSLA